MLYIFFNLNFNKLNINNIKPHIIKITYFEKYDR